MYTYIRMKRIHLYVCVYICMCVNVYVCIYTYISLYAHIRVQEAIYRHFWVLWWEGKRTMYIYVCVCVYIHIYIYLHVYLYIYIYTCIFSFVMGGEEDFLENYCGGGWRRHFDLASMNLWDVTHYNIYRDAFICATWLMAMNPWDVTHLFEWHDSFMCDVTHWNFVGRMKEAFWTSSNKPVGRDSFAWRTWRIHMCIVTHWRSL